MESRSDHSSKTLFCDFRTPPEVADPQDAIIPHDHHAVQAGMWGVFESSLGRLWPWPICSVQRLLRPHCRIGALRCQGPLLPVLTPFSASIQTPTIWSFGGEPSIVNKHFCADSVTFVRAMPSTSTMSNNAVTASTSPSQSSPACPIPPIPPDQTGLIAGISLLSGLLSLALLTLTIVLVVGKRNGSPYLTSIWQERV